MRWFALLVVGCAGEGSDDTSDTDGAADTDGPVGDDDDDTDSPPVGACSWVGEWTMTDAFCGSFAFEEVDEALFVFASTETGCLLNVSATSGPPRCSLLEAIDFEEGVGPFGYTSWSGVSNGGTSSDPAGCAATGEPFDLGVVEVTETAASLGLYFAEETPVAFSACLLQVSVELRPSP